MSVAAVPELSSPARAFLDAAPHGLLIGGAWVPPEDGSVRPTVDPSTEQPLAPVAHAGAADIDHAVQAAGAAFEGPWSRLSAAARGGLLFELARSIDEHADELSELEAADNGKPVKLARAVDVRLAAEHFRYYAGWPTKIEGATIPVGAPDMHVYTRLEPVGVCAQIIPWNFPLLMAAWKLAPALAAGCTVVLKPAEETPLTALRLGQLAAAAGMPDGVVNVVPGGADTGEALVRHPGVAKISFTGSTAVGRRIAERAGRDLKRLTLELGGKSPSIILPDADLDAAVKGAYTGIYYNSGQACNAGSRLYVPAARLDEVTTRLTERAAKARLGPGLASGTQVGPLISERQRDRVRAFIQAGREDGAELLAGGEGDVPDTGYFLRPTLFAGAGDDSRIVREEIFGPVLVALSYDDVDEAVARANASDYGLAAGVWTRDVAAAHRVAARLHAGTVYLNAWGLTDPAAPFGGVKGSGIGREMGRPNLDAYLETKTVWTALGA